MLKSILIDKELIDAIANSLLLSDKEKLNFLKYIWYMTFSERRELQKLV